VPKLGAAAVLTVAAIVVTAGVVLAHSRPVRFDPPPGVVLTAAPQRVQGWFTAEIRREPGSSFIRVTDAQGGRVDSGEVDLSADRRQMSVGLRSGLGPGRYLVHWSTLDDGDGEVFAGCYVFFVGQEAADMAAAERMPLDGGDHCPATGHAGGGTKAAIEISIPAVVHGGAATLTITPSGFTPRAPTGSGRDPQYGHYHVYLDKVPLDVLGGDHADDEGDHGDQARTPTAGHKDMDEAREGGLVENPTMWFASELKLTNLSPGKHTVSVALFHDDHSPFSPPVVATKTFTVEPDSDDGVPVWGLALGIAAGAVVWAAGGRLLARS
jgi:methionine-rich copper-binding protein CopC